ncbi:hypothetical protein [Tunturiibacter gelidiferens]|uniref:hypothetical protein n=1 Tax=Tunturiibacter gelidiferens TaxID=3069689 RepID=UPI003D9B534E
MGYGFTQAVTNNVISNIVTFGLGAAAKGGNLKGRLMGGLLGLGANLALGAGDNYFQIPKKTTLVYKKESPHL